MESVREYEGVVALRIFTTHDTNPQPVLFLSFLFDAYPGMHENLNRKPCETTASEQRASYCSLANLTSEGNKDRDRPRLEVRTEITRNDT